MNNFQRTKQYLYIMENVDTVSTEDVHKLWEFCFIRGFFHHNESQIMLVACLHSWPQLAQLLILHNCSTVILFCLENVDQGGLWICSSGGKWLHEARLISAKLTRSFWQRQSNVKSSERCSLWFTPSLHLIPWPKN